LRGNRRHRQSLTGFSDKFSPILFHIFSLGGRWRVVGD
jgi:hypothetical protein